MIRLALVQRAKEARKKAYCPYSGFAVGAAMLCADGSVYDGCNIENAGFTATCCAERTAFFRAVNDGKRDFKAIAIAGGGAGEEPTGICAPCGVCRQVMAEFCGPGFEILLTDGHSLQVQRWRSCCPWLLAQAIYNKRKKEGCCGFTAAPFAWGGYMVTLAGASPGRGSAGRCAYTPRR